MNEKAINKLLEKFLGYLETAEGFAIEQAPDFVQQLLAYYTWELQFYIMVACILFIFSIPLFTISVYVGSRTQREGVAVFCLFGCIVSIVFFISGPICFMKHYTQYKKLELAPKVFLLEKAREVVR